MISVIYILLALLSLAASIFCFGNLLVSCAGHPPTSVVGMWIIPLSLVGGSVFLYLSLLLWKSRNAADKGRLKGEAILLPKKILIFLFSFIVAATAFFVLSLAIFAFAAATDGKIDKRLGYVLFYALYALFTVVPIYLGKAVYGKLKKSAFNK